VTVFARWGGRMLAAALLLAACGSGGPKGEMPTQETLKKVPAASLFQMGQEFAHKGDLMRAAQYMAIAFERGHDPKRVVSALMNVYVASSRFRDAIDLAERRLVQDPYDWRLHVVAGALCLSVREDARALDHANKALQSEPNDASVHYLMAVVQRDAVRDPAKARVHFARYLELDAKGEHAPEAQAFLDGLGTGEVQDLPEPTPEPLPTKIPYSSVTPP
jgi:Flp pilus assembly protein TadD